MARRPEARSVSSPRRAHVRAVRQSVVGCERRHRPLRRHRHAPCRRAPSITGLRPASAVAEGKNRGTGGLGQRAARQRRMVEMRMGDEDVGDDLAGRSAAAGSPDSGRDRRGRGRSPRPRLRPEDRCWCPNASSARDSAQARGAVRVPEFRRARRDRGVPDGHSCFRFLPRRGCG